MYARRMWQFEFVRDISRQFKICHGFLQDIYARYVAISRDRSEFPRIRLFLIRTNCAGTSKSMNTSKSFKQFIF